jgi:hypothetical protein
MGGNFSDAALFLKHDEVQIRDEVYCDSFDEPRIVYWVTPVVVQHRVSHWQAKLMRRSDWRSLSNIPKLYPRFKHHWSRDAKIVNSLNEEVALGGGWADTPGVFEPYRDPNEARPKEPNPLKWVDSWLPDLLSAEHRKKIAACLWSADSIFWKKANYPASTGDSMCEAFVRIAHVLFGAGLLTESRLKEDIPALVWDTAIAGGWWHLASDLPQSIFPYPVGHYWVWRDESRDWADLFRAEIATWKGRLIVAPEAESEKTADRPRHNPEPTAGASEIPLAGARKPQLQNNEQSHMPKPVRRNKKYSRIDEALKKISESLPRTQEEVFQSLEDRHVPLPLAEPFSSASGWMAGFGKDRLAARSWLSKRWGELSLSPLPRGPKNPKK